MTEAVEAEANWGRRLLLGGGIAVVVVVAVLIASAAVPRWWAHRIGDRVDGSITQGVLVLMTLGIVLGVGSGAHAGERTLDVEAPAFRGATLAGAILAGLLATYLWYLLASRDSERDEHRRAENRLEAATASPEESETTPPSAA